MNEAQFDESMNNEQRKIHSLCEGAFQDRITNMALHTGSPWLGPSFMTSALLVAPGIMSMVDANRSSFVTLCSPQTAITWYPSPKQCSTMYFHYLPDEPIMQTFSWPASKKVMETRCRSSCHFVQKFRDRFTKIVPLNISGQ